MATDVIDKVRKLVTEGGMSKSSLARAAGLHANTLRDCTEDDWNPTAETLGKLERVLFSNDEREVLVPIEEIIDEARNGRMFILVDDEDRENEGDLIIPAQMATPAAINFMAMHGRGLICLAITSQRVDELGLNLMSRHNGTRHETAFTISIEAREGVTTGISAGDRARTISVAIDGTKTRDDIVTPGHVFPLRARDGGVLVRTGHTEAAVDISRLAGLNPSGVICEIMKEDGTMARMDDLIGFARLHDLKIGTIRDLIAYRRKHDRMIEKRNEISFHSRHGGDWVARSYFNRATGDETVALVKGRIDPSKPTMVRMHTLSFFADIFGEDTGDRGDLLHRSMEMIGEEGSGVIVVINRPMNKLMSRVMDIKQEFRNGGTPDLEELRDYGVGAQILAELGIHDMVLLTNTHHSLVALEGYGLNIVGERPIIAPTSEGSN
ncbi:3,4-dihydroxy-2-butanone-4-phosphate synthase [Novosphingobium resinovorum]|uniref:3,4-dihydroxy-2-butanone 4-phosphate synthase n=1 Tax=Novosphingobium resinovorum TaxID=158500 RepID=A0A031K8L1_9SPHN|nr:MULTISPECIES: 3,4-dihydroxy-2-butanone-4-phosphate synthase [Sphingomonadaceae]AOR75933.1 3,4-dihydroxy-2-butanone-4-phosphate synthase [Novosphingobium resinovorum]EJU13941.1 3,4-dihydroxy-2-butanone 4-phosphate synthase [Sphingomonas sp. LH128]EZP84942.1 3,4-dihydroxy-2-butanone 4-phosphate synthase [Novosphingobium resinovorum]MBF7011308.1 3,4-dihydroxy-2-butanone-4-phosphate synthase [Novosphingobium sp. HR1a]WJM29290.1 3,4-dihydroxy-2-butanone-4-phosphate synthase [Novosphingobium resi